MGVNKIGLKSESTSKTGGILVCSNVITFPQRPIEILLNRDVDVRC